MRAAQMDDVSQCVSAYNIFPLNFDSTQCDPDVTRTSFILRRSVTWQCLPLCVANLLFPELNGTLKCLHPSIHSSVTDELMLFDQLVEFDSLIGVLKLSEQWLTAVCSSTVIGRWIFVQLCSFNEHRGLEIICASRSYELNTKKRSRTKVTLSYGLFRLNNY